MAPLNSEILWWFGTWKYDVWCVVPKEMRNHVDVLDLDLGCFVYGTPKQRNMLVVLDLEIFFNRMCGVWSPKIAK